MSKTAIKKCPHHGETEFATEGKIRVRWRCKKCRVEHVTRCRQNRKKKCVEYKGCECKNCGYKKCIDALEFHHRDPSKKEFSIACSGATRSWARTKKELDKCDLLCANCHREVEAAARQ